MINFLTKPSINDSWSVLLFDFQSDNPSFLIRMKEGKRREVIYKEHCAEAAGITFLHRLSTKTDTKKENASETGQKRLTKSLVP